MGFDSGPQRLQLPLGRYKQCCWTVSAGCRENSLSRVGSRSQGRAAISIFLPQSRKQALSAENVHTRHVSPLWNGLSEADHSSLVAPILDWSKGPMRVHPDRPRFTYHQFKDGWRKLRWALIGDRLRCWLRRARRHAFLGLHRTVRQKPSSTVHGRTFPADSLNRCLIGFGRSYRARPRISPR